MALTNEVERQFYLGVAGVSCWYARTTLTGAAPSPELDFDAAAEPIPEPVVDAANESVAGRQAPGQRRLQSLAAIQGLVKTPAAEPHRPVMPAPHSEAVSEPLKQASEASKPEPAVIAPEPDSLTASVAVGVTVVHWGFWFSQRFVLISARSTDASARLQEALAANILQALGQTTEQQQTVHWPVFNNPAVPGNDEAGLKAVLRELAGEFTGRRVITLGLLPELSADARSAWLESVLGQATVESGFSLAALSADPDRKRQLWTSLRPLIGPGQ